MLWDGLILLVILTLGIAGWTVGIINSWRGPFAMVVATLVTQQFYVDFATFLLQQLRMSPQYSIVLAYVLLWGASEMATEVLMMLLLQFNRKVKPLFFERLFGLAFGLIKGCIVVILPAVALQAPIKVPTAPPDKSALINPVDSGADRSMLLPYLDGIGKGLYPTLGNLVASTKEPSFKPDFHGDENPN
jgi:uncharacterized membrane protein required for colicin V production